MKLVLDNFVVVKFFLREPPDWRSPCPFWWHRKGNPRGAYPIFGVLWGAWRLV